MDTTRVSTIELFFDLVFVFTITRLTHLVEHAHAALDYLRALLVLTLIWWIYAGYAWLTNGAGTERRMRPVLLAAMAGFLLIAIAIPEAFGGSGMAFGLAYLFVVLLHLAAFYSMGGAGVGRALLRLAPFNIGAAVLALAAGMVDTSWSWMFFLAAAGTLTVATLRHSERGFPINAPHFVERHGLILIIALGETVVAVGAGAGERVLTERSLLLIALCVGLLASIWWSYFDRDDAGAEHALQSRKPEERALVAIRAFWTPFLVKIFGIVLIAAALRRMIAEDHAADGASWVLAAGLAIYLAGSALFRAAVGMRPVATRVMAAVIACPLALTGARWGPAAEVSALTALMLTLLWLERHRGTTHSP